MAVPEYQTFMLPILKISSDGHEHSLSEVTNNLAVEFQLTDEDKKELLPSGRKSKFTDRVGWATTYLKKAGLLKSIGRGKFHITERGLTVLRTQHSKITKKFLEQFPEFIEFQNLSPLKREEDEGNEIPSQTPEEVLEVGYQTLKNELLQELLQYLKSCSSSFFEKAVVDLIVSMGYGGSRKDAGQAIGGKGDEGIDGIIKEDKLGLDIIYIQAKKWEATVGRPIVQAFAGSLEGMRAQRGLLITTSQFSREAKEYVNKIGKKIVLIDGQQLAQLMIEHDVGVKEVGRFVIKKVDSDYFDEEV